MTCLLNFTTSDKLIVMNWFILIDILIWKVITVREDARAHNKSFVLSFWICSNLWKVWLDYSLLSHSMKTLMMICNLIIWDDILKIFEHNRECATHVKMRARLMSNIFNHFGHSKNIWCCHLNKNNIHFHILVWKSKLHLIR